MTSLQEFLEIKFLFLKFKEDGGTADQLPNKPDEILNYLKQKYL